MKQPIQKVPRGQMIYAPISSDRVSRSPFSSNKKIGIASNKVNHNISVQQSQSQNTKLNSIIKVANQNNSKVMQLDSTQRIIKQDLNHIVQELQQSKSKNQQMRSREEVYISKLMKLQQGLEKQHEQFMNLQELYTELYNTYKQKQQEVAQLELRYKQTQRMRNSFNSTQKNPIQLSEVDKNSIKTAIIEQNLKNELAQLIYQNKRLNETNEKLIQELHYIKSKQKLNQSKRSLQSKVFEEISDWQKQFNLEREDKIKLEYENKFFKIRIEDLQKTISQLENVISMKQSEVIKMREQKMHIRRQSSQKALNRSPPKPNIDSARSKVSNQENKKLAKLIEDLQIQNSRLREQNFTLKQRLKGTSFRRQNPKLSESALFNLNNQHLINRKLEYEKDQRTLDHNQRTHYQNQNYNSQNMNEQYFSFSRQREERQSQESDLPSFPMDLQIEGIIRKHKQNNQNNQTSSHS